MSFPRLVQTALFQSIHSAFPAMNGLCHMTLRQGDEIDTSYYVSTVDDPLPTDWRAVSGADLESHHWALPHLDPESWLFYLPAFLVYAVEHSASGESSAITACINTLRPPSHIPPRFKMLTAEQRQAVVATLDFLAFGSESEFQHEASQALEEYWLSDPLYPDT